MEYKNSYRAHGYRAHVQRAAEQGFTPMTRAQWLSLVFVILQAG